LNGLAEPVKTHVVGKISYYRANNSLVIYSGFEPSK